MTAKPCPFCGSTKVQVEDGDTFRWRMTVCQECGAQGPEVRCQTTGEGNMHDWDADARVRAIEEWNKRSEAP